MEITEEVKERIRDAIARAIGGGAYDCTRHWSAWGYGTMEETDFIPIIAQNERLSEITDAVIEVIIPTIKKNEISISMNV